VYLPAIEGYVPRDVLRTFRAFLEFCYIARHDIINEDTLAQLTDALARFHHHRTIFEDLGIRPEGFALPRQHSLVHYPALVRSFGAPNGLCSSITESKHIAAIKKPWRRSNRYNALGQMLLTNQRLDKLAASYVDFANRGMLDGTCLSDALKLIGRSSIILVLSDNNNSLEKLRNEDGTDDNDDVLDDETNKDMDNDAVDGPTVLAQVKLAKTVCTYIIS
jgi:hypothetical protein